MALDTYVNFKNAIADKIERTDLAQYITDAVTAFEAEAAREMFKERLAEKTTILVPTNPALITISNAVSNGGLIRLTVTSTSTYTTGQELIVSGVQGTTEANGKWLVTVINGTTLDLQGSTFTNTYVSGGTVQSLPGIATLPSDYSAYRRVTWTGTPETTLDYLAPDILHAYYPFSQLTSSNTNRPQYFTIEGSTLTVRNSSGTPLEFDYYATTAALSTSLNWLFTNHVDCYWNGVLAEMYRYLNDYDKAQVFEQKKLAVYGAIKLKQFREGGQLSIRTSSPTP